MATASYSTGPMSEDKGSAPEKSPQNPDVICLKPKMSLLNGVTIIVGSIIGSGIFVSPKAILWQTGSVGLSLVVWITSGVFSMIGAYCYAELGCMITKTGGDYIYIMKSFGPFVAFVRLWVECMIVTPCTQAIVALTFSFYVLRTIFPDCELPDTSVKFLACLCICLLMFVNCWDVKWSTRVQDIFTFCKLFALVIIIGTGLVQLAYGHTEYFTFEGSQSDFRNIALSFYSGLFAYNGWNNLNFVIEELKEPHKNLPKAIFISCVLVTVVYTLTIVAFHTTLSVREVLGSDAVAVTFVDRIYGSMAWIVHVFIAMSTFGWVNGNLLTSSRLFYAGAEHGQMPRIFAMIQVKRLTPAPSVIFMSILSIKYLCYGNIYSLIMYVGFATWLAIGMAVVCLPYLRWKQPDLPRPIRVSLIFPAIYILGSIFIIVVAMMADPIGTGFGWSIIASSVPVYSLFVYWENKPKVARRAIDNFDIILQKLLIVVPSEKSS